MYKPSSSINDDIKLKKKAYGKYIVGQSGVLIESVNQLIIIWSK